MNQTIHACMKYLAILMLNLNALSFHMTPILIFCDSKYFNKIVSSIQFYLSQLNVYCESQNSRKDQELRLTIKCLLILQLE